MESITTSTHAEIVDSWVVTLQKLKSTQGITEYIKQKESKQTQESPMKIKVFLMEILLLMTIQMQRKTARVPMYNLRPVTTRATRRHWEIRLLLRIRIPTVIVVHL